MSRFNHKWGSSIEYGGIKFNYSMDCDFDMDGRISVDIEDVMLEIEGKNVADIDLNYFLGLEQAIKDEEEHMISAYEDKYYVRY